MRHDHLAPESDSGATATTIPELVALWAERSPQGVAIVAPGRAPLSYGGLQRQITETVAALHNRGLGRGTRVALALPDGPELAVAFLATATAAAVAPLNPALTTVEAELALASLGAKALIVAAGATPPARAAAAGRGLPVIELVAETAAAGCFTLDGVPSGSAASGDPLSDDVALLLHTSGTTARPKLVPLRHGQLCASARQIARTLALGPADRSLNVMPLFHIHGLVAGLLATLVAGGGVACPPGFQAPHFFGWVEECGPTWYTAVPTMHRSVLDRAPDHAALVQGRPFRFLRSSSAPLPPSLLAELEATFAAPVVEAYGMTEAAHQMASNPLPPRQRKPGSVGLAAGPEVAILGEDDQPLAAGEVGEVVIRGPSVFGGYEANQAANAAAFVDGWFRTGDQGVLDAGGYLFLTGRLKELINRGGEKVAPREVEDALLAHPMVAQAVAFALPDERLGEEVAAAVVPPAGHPRTNGEVPTETELRRFVADRLAPYKVPRRVLFLEELPKGSTGKVQRIGLADRLGLKETPLPERVSIAAVAPRSPVEEIVAAVWVEVLGREGVGVDDDFLALGGDSILATQVVARLRALFGLDVTVATFFEAASVASMALIVEDLLASEDDGTAKDGAQADAG